MGSQRAFIPDMNIIVFYSSDYWLLVQVLRGRNCDVCFVQDRERFRENKRGESNDIKGRGC